jgi:hypothetical protein
VNQNFGRQTEQNRESAASGGKMQSETQEAAEKLEVAFDFGWRSGSPLR